MLRQNSTIAAGSVLRRLGTFERALFLSDQHAPFNVVSVLRLEHAPAPSRLYQVLVFLQKRHPLLQACIKNQTFVRLSDQSISLQVTEQDEDANWLEVVEHEMNTRLDPEHG